MAHKEILAETALTKQDGIYLDRLNSLLQQFPSLQEARLIGGLACKLLTDKKYTGRLSPVTDIDLYTSKIPEEISDLVKTSNLTEYVNSYSKSTGQVRHIRLSDFTVKKLDFDGDEIDIFEGDVGGLKLDDNYPSRKLSLENSEINIAHPGAVLATILNPNAYTDNRGKRARFLIETLSQDQDSIKEAIEVCASIMDANGITQNDFKTVHARILQRYKSSPDYVHAADALYDSLVK